MKQTLLCTSDNDEEKDDGSTETDATVIACLKPDTSGNMSYIEETKKSVSTDWFQIIFLM